MNTAKLESRSLGDWFGNAALFLFQSTYIHTIHKPTLPAPVSDETARFIPQLLPRTSIFHTYLSFTISLATVMGRAITFPIIFQFFKKILRINRWNQLQDKMNPLNKSDFIKIAWWNWSILHFTKLIISVRE